MTKIIIIFIMCIILFTACVVTPEQTLSKDSAPVPNHETEQTLPDESTSQTTQEPEQGEKVSDDLVQNDKLKDINRYYDDIQPLDPKHNYQEDLTHPIIEQRPTLCGIAEEFLADPDTFSEKYTAQEKFDKGFGREIYVGRLFGVLDMLHIQKQQPTPVIGDYQIGESIDKLIQEFGMPHYTDAELNLIGYRFSDFYFVVEMEDTKSKQITILKTPETSSSQHELLNWFRELPEDSTKDFVNALYEREPSFFYNDTFAAFGGWIMYGSGINFLVDYYQLVEVWGNYEGDIYFDKPGFEYRFYTEDFFFTQISNYYRFWQEFLVQEGVDSPNGRFTALPKNAYRPINGDWVLLRCNDGSEPDRSFSTLHLQYDLYWASDRYLLLEVYLNTPIIYDMKTGKVEQIHTAANLTGEYLAAGYKYEIAYSIKMSDNQLIWYDENDNQFLISYTFDPDGTIQFSNERITQEQLDSYLQELRPQ